MGVAAFPPYGLWPLAILSIAGFFLAVRKGTPVYGFVCGGVYGAVFFGGLLSWLRVIGVDAWFGTVALESLFTAITGYALVVTYRIRWWPLTATTIWLSGEFARSHMPWGGFPWGRLAFSQSTSPLLPLAALGGTPAVSAAVALLGAIITWFTVSPVTKRRATLAGVGVSAIFGVAIAIPVPNTGFSSVTVAAVQGNVPRSGLDFEGQREAVLRNHVTVTRELAADIAAGKKPPVDVIIWPENSSDIDPYIDLTARQLISDAVTRVGVPTLVGAMVGVDNSRGVENRGIVWSPVTGPGEYYAKRHPVPFGEYIPLRGVLQRWITRLQRIPRDMRAGDKPGVLNLGPARIGDVICFEVAYDGVVRDAVVNGGTLLVVQTNNATYGRTALPPQQLAMSQLRAVEHGRGVVVAATSGISAIITPNGQVTHRTPEFTPQVLISQVPLRTQLTLADRLGEWPAFAAAIVGGIAVIISLRRERRKPSAERIIQTVSDASASEVSNSKTLVVIPTYNEADNVADIVSRVRKATPHVVILIADDNSPDGTGIIADQLAETDSQVHVLHRPGKQGLGAAYLAGFRWGLDRDFGVIVEMDADGSHLPEELPRLLAALNGSPSGGTADLVLGSRWVPGGEVRNWPTHRSLLSRGGNLYTRLALGIPLRDATGGFRAFRRQTLEGLDLDTVTSQGYCFQVDLAWRAIRTGYHVAEVPITFVERERGNSKMSKSIVAEALWRVTVWGAQYRLGRAPQSQALRR
jgi:apolipoprotein N-acyltransferase